MPSSITNIWNRLNGPLKIGLSFALIAIILFIIGLFRDPGTPVNAWSLTVGSLISGVVWGLIFWAIATAAVTVEEDVAASGGDREQNGVADDGASN